MVLAIAGTATACAPGATAPSGSGGRGSGGAAGTNTGTGGGGASGGAVGSGGRSASGGASGSFASGGGTASGGGPGTGGSNASGGSGGSGGGVLTGTGGAAATGGRGGSSGSGGAASGSGGTSPDAGVADGPTDRGGDTAAGADATGNDPNAIDIYLIAGQSNATGQGYTKNIPSSFVVNTKVQLYHSAEIISGAAANTWIALRHASEAADSGGDRFGPELGFGTNIQSFYPDRLIGIIKHAKSATDLVAQWAPGANATDTSRFGVEFKTFVDTVDRGLKAIRDKGKNPTIRALLWQQGESDVDMGGAAASQYGQNLSAFISRVRQQWNSPNMLFVYGYIYPKSNYGTARDQVRQAQTNIDQDSGNALAVKGAFVVMTDDLSLRANDPNTPYPNDLIHFGSQGQLDLGKRMATKVRDKLQLP